MHCKKNNNSIVYASESEYLLDDFFESQRSQDNWSKLWMREEGKVKQGYDLMGINNSRCLLIESSSEKDWPEVNYEIELVNNEKFSKLEFPPFFILTDNMRIVLTLFEGILMPCNSSIGNLPSYLRYIGEKSYTLNKPEYDLPAKGYVVYEKGRIWKKCVYN